MATPTNNPSCDIEEYLIHDSNDSSDNKDDESEVMVNYEFSDDEDDDVASVDHLSECDDEIRHVRMIKINKPREEQSRVQVNKLPHETEESVYEHDEFLTDLCDEYQRESIVQYEVQSDNENEIVDGDVDTQNTDFPIHNPNVPWNVMKPIVGERYSLVKPNITMLEEIRVFVMERIEKMTKKASKWTHGICPVIQKKVEQNKELMRFWRVTPNGGNMFEVRQGLDGYVVDTTTKTCTCRIWQLSGIPCPHAVAALYFIHQEPCKFVSSSFSRTNFMATYSHTLRPLNGQKLWPRTNFIKPLPPMARRMPGRPRRSRKKDASERESETRRSKINAFGNRVVKKTGKKQICRNCLELGHNSRSCTKPKKDVPVQPKKPVGRPRKENASQAGSELQNQNIGKCLKKGDYQKRDQ